MKESRIEHMIGLIEKKYPDIDRCCDRVMDIMYQWGFMSATRLELHTGYDVQKAKYCLMYLTLCGELQKGKDGVTYSLTDV